MICYHYLHLKNYIYNQLILMIKQLFNQYALTCTFCCMYSCTLRQKYSLFALDRPHLIFVPHQQLLFSSFFIFFNIYFLFIFIYFLFYFFTFKKTNNFMYFSEYYKTIRTRSPSRAAVVWDTTTKDTK